MMENAGLLIDTDLMIEFLRGRKEAREFVNDLDQRPCVSAVTVAELYAGVREGWERTELDAFVANIEVLSLSSEASAKGGLYRRDYGKSHGVGLSDALIAATAELSSRSVVTFNRKHFPMLSDVIVPYQRN